MSYSWRKFRRAALGLTIGVAVSLLILWLLGKMEGDYGLMAAGLYVFLIAPFFVQWIMDKCRHPDDVDGSNVTRMFKWLVRRVFRSFMR